LRPAAKGCAASRLAFNATRLNLAKVLAGATQPENKKAPVFLTEAFLFMAEGQGFEPWEPLDSSVFKTGAFDHSATPP
jgi:hypothetical protein